MRAKGLALLLVGLPGLAGLASLALRRPAVEAGQGRTFELEIESAFPTNGLTSSACSLRGIVTIARGPRLKMASQIANPVGASCAYLFSGGVQGRECLLEFPRQHAEALRAKSLAARSAAFYYWHRQGGIMLPVISESTNTFVMLDARWCTLFGAADGFMVGETS